MQMLFTGKSVVPVHLSEGGLVPVLITCLFTVCQHTLQCSCILTQVMSGLNPPVRERKEKEGLSVGVQAGPWSCSAQTQPKAGQPKTGLPMKCILAARAQSHSHSLPGEQAVKFRHLGLILLLPLGCIAVLIPCLPLDSFFFYFFFFFYFLHSIKINS